ncbi:hypothetical protein RISK_003737 [Rhodopirellula islandica]|uniref:Uncharacterized protein n=1 Tax=Rhodopirellula islandica TaxID=595434 RepID=A0A0J1BCB5_RHOIS|nr:hypothetical protein RISK_003737 [Rhodopirellula islandica]
MALHVYHPNLGLKPKAFEWRRFATVFASLLGYPTMSWVSRPRS